jgi:hypothetical protein
MILNRYTHFIGVSDEKIFLVLGGVVPVSFSTGFRTSVCLFKEHRHRHGKFSVLVIMDRRGHHQHVYHVFTVARQ